MTNYDHEAVAVLKKPFEKYRNLPGIEVEFRIGHFSRSVFDTNIGKDAFEKIIKLLSSCKIWDSVIVTNTDNYYLSEKRLTINKPNSNCIKKKKLETIDFEFVGSGFDVRVCFSEETQCRRFAIEKAESKRSIKRTSYLIDGVSFDASIITIIENGIEQFQYSVEIEIKDLSGSSDYILHNCFLKVKDIAECVEKLEEHYSLRTKLVK
jgi:hypothetical protein